MNRPPFFSVVVPCYNCADFLEEALASIFQQTESDFEVVVVDNSSTDRTPQVLDRYRDRPLQVLTVENHGVIGYSRNRGIEAAAGEWIAFLDADDLWRPEKLGAVRKAIRKSPDAVALCHHEAVVREGRLLRNNRYTPRLPNLHESLLVYGNCMSTSAVAVRKDVAEKLGGFSEREEFITVEDYEFWIRLSREGRVLFVPEVLGEFRVHGENSSRKAALHAGALVRVLDHHLDRWRTDEPRQRGRVQRARSRARSSAARILLGGACFAECRRRAGEAVRLNPLNWKGWALLALSTVRYPLPVHL